jgi:hypothetical protein
MVTKKKSPTLKLTPFNWVTPKHGAIQINSFTYTDDEGDECLSYNGMLILWLESDGVEVPIMLETQIYGDDIYEVSYEVFQVAMSIVGKVYKEVIVFDSEGDVEEEFSIDDVLEEYGDDSCGDCDGCDSDDKKDVV